jgi:F-box-like
MIDMLPDNVLLEIFHFYKEDPESRRPYSWCWITLIHVCRRWRHIIFGSPRRLILRLVCSARTPARRSLDIWPPFPIFLSYTINQTVDEEGLENVIAALECRKRISLIFIFDVTGGSALQKSIAAMLEPFPVLMECHLISTSKPVSVPVLPESFLGGSAPLLVMFELRGIPFPTFPNFVLSSTQIRYLYLDDIPHSGYISPDVMVTCLAALPYLTSLLIGFQSPLSRPAEIAPPPLTRAVFPVLNHLSFRGVSEYFEAFIARIEGSRPLILDITFFMDLIFDIPRLHNFINCTLAERVNQASMVFTSQEIRIMFGIIQLGIKCERLDWQLSSITQILSRQLPRLHHVERFEIREPGYPLHRIEWEDDPDMDPSQWLELFRLLIAVQSLYVSERLVYRVAAALKELTGEMATEVLPALRSLSLEGLQPSGPVQDAIKSFVTVRQLTGLPVVIQPWKRQSRAYSQRRFRMVKTVKLASDVQSQLGGW